MEPTHVRQWQTFDESCCPISSGVIHRTKKIRSGLLTQSVQMCEIDVHDPFTEIRVVSANGGVTQLETVRNLVYEQQALGKRVVAGINGDFFSSLGIPSGLQITDGEIICSPLNNKVAMAIMNDRSVRLISAIRMDGRVCTESGSSLAIDAVNRTRTLRHEDHLFVYTARFGSSTRTPFGGVEVILDCSESDVLVPGQPLTGIVRSVLERGNSPIPSGCLILSATGGKGNWVREHLQLGDKVQIVISYDQGLNDAYQVLSGNSTLAYVLLEKGEIPSELLDPNHPFYSDRHPRTMIATKNERLFLITVDGRQPGYSDGITLAEGAYYLQTLGMETAINVDGGGSTTCLVRSIGNSELDVVNRPSDGFERPVGNGLLILNTAPAGKLRQLVVTPNEHVTIFKNSTVHFEVKGIDEYLNPISVSPETLKWNVNGDIGRVDNQGMLKAGGYSGSGQLVVNTGPISAAVDIRVTDQIARLEISPGELVAEPGSTIQFLPQAYGEQGEKIQIAPEILQWSVCGDIGAVTNCGVLHVAEKLIQGKVCAKLEQYEAVSHIQVGKEPLVFVDFESTQGLKIKTTNVVPDSVIFQQASRPQPIRFGAFSGKLTYDFTGMTGVSKVMIALLNEHGKVGREIPGAPYRFGLWVYGDAQNHWLRLSITDASGNNRRLNFTPVGGLNWTGWRYVSVDVPSNVVYPVTVYGIVLVETDDSNKNQGVLYFDNLRAEYVNLNEDLEGPRLTDFKPQSNTVLDTIPSEISVRILDDDSGVNPHSIQVWINERLVTHTYDSTTGVVSCPISTGSSFSVKVQAADNAGNPTAPVEWRFQIDESKLARKGGRDGKQAI